MKEFNYKNINIIISDGVFDPRYSIQDDFLLENDLIANTKCKKVLDVGTGSGFLPIYWLKHHTHIESVVAVDISPKAIQNAECNFKKNLEEAEQEKLSFYTSNLFQNIHESEKFDLIVFNGPHLPHACVDQKGALNELYYAFFDDGLDFAKQFFSQASNYLNEGGKIVYTFSDYPGVDESKNHYLESIFNFINESGLWAYLGSLVQITNDFDPELKDENFTKYIIPIWYNIVVSKSFEPSSEFIFYNGFRKSIQKIQEYFSINEPTKQLYNEYEFKLITILRCLFSQLHVSLNNPADWLIGGFSIPSWSEITPTYYLINFMGSLYTKEYKAKFELSTAKMAEILDNKFGKNELIFFVDFFTKKDSENFDAIEAKILENIQHLEINYITLNKKLLFNFQCDQERIDIVSHSEEEIENFIEQYYKQGKEKFSSSKKDAYNYVHELKKFGQDINDEMIKKMFCSLYINFMLSAVPRDGNEKKGINFIRFRKISYSRFDNNGCQYFFSSKVFQYSDTLNMLEEIINSVNVGLQSFILRYKRNLHAIKAANAAIMARNMSHNLGSHILSYVKNDLLDANKLNEKINPSAEGGRKYLTGLGKLINYIQERQDFIATITSELIPTLVPVYFKDFIFDEINHDWKAERHNKQSIPRTTNLLLEYIAKSEELNRETLSINYNGLRLNTPNPGKDEERILNELRDKQLLLPGGILGRQAIFSILENVIRNTVKHAKRNNKNIDINITIEDHKEDFYKICIVQQNCIAPDIDDLQGKINSRIINDVTGSINPWNKGLKEMKISAAWLRRIESHEMGNYDDILKVSKNDKDELVFELLVYKPKKIAIIDASFEKLDKSKSNNFGVKIFEPDEKQLNELQRYEFVIFTGEEESDFFQKLQNTTARIIKFEPILEQELLNLKILTKNEKLKIIDYAKFYEFIYYYHVSKKYLNDKDYITILIYDAKENESSQKMFPEWGNNKNIKVIQSSPGQNQIKKLTKIPNIIFKDHFESRDEYKKTIIFLEAFFNSEKPDFIEAISGGNSTDRIVRRQEKNILWALKTIESAYSKVLIIDERLWESRLDPKLKNLHTYKFINSLKELIQNSANLKKICELIKNNSNLVNEFNFGLSDVYYNKLTEIVNDDVKIDYNTIKSIVDAMKFPNNENGEYEKDDLINKEIMELKGVYIYNLFLSKDGNIFLKDLSFQSIGITEIKKREWNFVLIHQGIIDKIIDDNIDREQSLINFYKSHDFWSGLRYEKLVIHSGRSRPEYIPEHAIYIPFAAIENSLFDAKMTLTDLLFASS